MLDCVRMTCQKKEANLYQSYLDHNLVPGAGSDSLFARSITVLATRHHVSDDTQDASSRMSVHGATSSSSNLRSPFAKPLDSGFVADRTRRLFGPDALGNLDDTSTLDDLMTNWITVVNDKASSFSSKEAMWEFIEQSLLPCIQKIKTGEDDCGVTKDFWGYNEDQLMISSNSSAKILMAFISENTCRAGGIVLHPINGQHRMMIFHYLSCGVDPYRCFYQNSDNDERSTDYFEQNFALKNENPMVLYILSDDQKVDEELLQQCRDLSELIASQSRLAQDHGVFPHLTNLVNILERKKVDGGCGGTKRFPYYTEGLRIFPSVDGDDDAFLNAVSQVSGLFGEDYRVCVEVDDPNEGVKEVLMNFPGFYGHYMRSKANNHCLRELSECYTLFWGEVIYEVIRNGLVESKFHTNCTIAEVTAERTAIYENKMKFIERIQCFSRQRQEKCPLFLFRPSEHNSIHHLFRPSKGIDVIKFSLCNQFHDIDYGIFQLLLWALYDETSLQSVRRFGEQPSTYDQDNFKGGPEADSIVITTAMVMISTCTRAFRTYMAKFLKAASADRLHIGTLDYNLAAQICQDFLPALKKFGNSPILAGPFIKDVMKMTFLKGEISEIVSTDIITQDMKGKMTRKIKWTKHDIESRFNKDAVIDFMEKEWKSGLGFLSAVGLSYIVYLKPYSWYCDYQFLKADKTQSQFLTGCLEIWNSRSFLEGQHSICNWSQVTNSFLLKPVDFVRRSCDGTMPDPMTPSELISRYYHGSSTGQQKLETESFNYECVFLEVAVAWLLDHNRTLDFSETMKFYFAQPELSSRDKFLEIVPKFYEQLKKRFYGTARPTQKRQYDKLNVAASDRSEHERKRIKEVLGELNSQMEHFAFISWKAVTPYKSDVNVMNAQYVMNTLIAESGDPVADDEEEEAVTDVNDFIAGEAYEAGSGSDEE